MELIRAHLELGRGGKPSEEREACTGKAFALLSLLQADRLKTRVSNSVVVQSCFLLGKFVLKPIREGLSKEAVFHCEIPSPMEVGLLKGYIPSSFLLLLAALVCQMYLWVFYICSVWLNNFKSLFFCLF